MEQREQNPRRIRVGRLAATFFENPGAGVAGTNQDAGDGRSREDVDPLHTQQMTDQVGDGRGDGASSRVLRQDGQDQPQESHNLDSQPPSLQEVGASASASSSREDHSERSRLRHLLASGVVRESVLEKMERELTLKIIDLSSRKAAELAETEALKHSLREERARGEMLWQLLNATRAELRLLQESEMMAPQGQGPVDSAPTIDLQCANDADKGRAAELPRCRASEPGPSDEATASSSSQVVQDELAAGGSGSKNSTASDPVEATEKEQQE